MFETWTKPQHKIIQDANPDVEPEAETQNGTDAEQEADVVDNTNGDLDDEDDEDVDVDANKSDKPDEVSPSPALDIEGVVVGEAENAGVQSEGGQPMTDDTDEVY